MTALDAEWLASAVAASADRLPTGLRGSAVLLKGKTPLLTIAVDEGRITGGASGTPECEFPFTKVQIEEYLAGRLKLAVEYMRGDLKATGSTAAIVAVIEALDFLNQ